MLWKKYSMFSHEKIQKYNETDIHIYRYIVSNIDKIQYMTIRELAKEFVIKNTACYLLCNRFFSTMKHGGDKL